MAIFTMCDATAPGAVRSEQWSRQTGRDNYLRESHKGLVLNTYERNGRDDSDFFAVVWNPEKGHCEHIEYASTRGWSYPNNAIVDATPETLAAYAAFQAEKRAKATRSPD